jgi:hypothetical protein
LIIIGIVFIGLVVWGIKIIPMQMSYSDSCENQCLSKNMSYEVRFMSIPWDALNGECYCKLLKRIK